jgi:hypothetical protein
MRSSGSAEPRPYPRIWVGPRGFRTPRPAGVQNRSLRYRRSACAQQRARSPSLWAATSAERPWRAARWRRRSGPGAQSCAAVARPGRADNHARVEHGHGRAAFAHALKVAQHRLVPRVASVRGLDPPRARQLCAFTRRPGHAQIRLGDDGALLTAFNVWSYGAVEIPFDFMISAFQRNGSQTPFGNSREARDELRRRINDAVPGANIPSEDDRIRPSFGLTALANEDVRYAFLAAVEWAFDQARAFLADT